MIEKRRFKLDDAGREFSLDRFDGKLAGLVLAEIEQGDDEALRAIVPPAWVLREVSDDLRYQGGHLAKFGIPAE